MSSFNPHEMSVEEFIAQVKATPYKVNIWDRRGFYAEESELFASREDAVDFALTAKAGKVAMVFYTEYGNAVNQVFQVGRHMYD